jgi:hypothetical protein
VKVGLDRRSQDAEDLPIEKVERVDEQKESQDAGAYRAPWLIAPAPGCQNLYPTDTNS